MIGGVKDAIIILRLCESCWIWWLISSNMWWQLAMIQTNTTGNELDFYPEPAEKWKTGRQSKAMGRLKQHPGDWQETEIQCRSFSAWSPEWQSGEKLVRERGTCYSREIKEMKAWLLIIILKSSYCVHFWHILKHPIYKNSLKQVPNDLDCLPLDMYTQGCVSEQLHPDRCSDTLLL